MDDADPCLSADRDPKLPPRVGDEYQAGVPPLVPIDRDPNLPCGLGDKLQTEIMTVAPRDRDPNLLPRVGDEHQAEILPFVPRDRDPNNLVPLAGDMYQPDILPFVPRDRDPILLPRVGNEYQAKIPSLLSRDWYLKHTEIPTNGIILPGTILRFLVGLPVSITWINDEDEHKPLEFNDHSNGASNGKLSSMSKEENKEKLQEQFRGKGKLVPVPGSMRQSWTDVEESGFLLGLYIFGKNLFQVIKLLESKSMGEIQSFYYGKFYQSAQYRRWSEGCRLKSRRCIYGHKIFTGWRQQELLSRLLPHLAGENKSSVLEVAKAFGEGKMELEDYVISLKDLVGLNALIEAVGIGKGKQDLTGLTMETPKSNQAGTIRPEIPTGKACNSLTPQEIVNFLTGGFRLSKARSHDLFWEAVWPRLLARGWHSEQPRDYFPIANSQSLVFLIPGIKKFSRRKLVKGDHYFDCVKDVLNKVALDSGLLELDVDTNAGDDMKREDFSDQQRHCYLKPRSNTVQNTDEMRFTVVDTSLGGGRTNRVRELRSLPIEANGISTSYSNSEESNEDSSEDATDYSHDMNGHGASKSRKNRVGNSFHEQNVQTAPSQCGLAKCSGLTGVRARLPYKQKVAKVGDVQPRKATKDRTIRRIKPGRRNFAAPLEQCPQSTVSSGELCSGRGVTNSSLDSTLDQEGNGNSGMPIEVINNGFDVDSFLQEMSTSTGPPFTGSSDVRNDQRPSDNNPRTAKTSGKKHHFRTLFDLNAVPGFEDTDIESSIMETTRRFKDSSKQEQEQENVNQSAAMPVCDDASDQLATTSSRRQGTRNRPPTAKALEAVAAGLLNPPNKRKNKDNVRDKATARPARRPRRAPTIGESLDAAAAMKNIKEIERGVSGCGSDVVPG